MGVGAGIFLIAVGAILKYAITDNVENIDLGAIGVILMVAGAAVTVLSLFFYAVARSRTDRSAVVREERYERDPL